MFTSNGEKLANALICPVSDLGYDAVSHKYKYTEQSHLGLWFGLCFGELVTEFKVTTLEIDVVHVKCVLK